jgi:hypothetical protein
MDFLTEFLPASLLDVSVGICQRVLVYESVLIRTQTGISIDHTMTTVQGTLVQYHPITVPADSNAFSVQRQVSNQNNNFRQVTFLTNP